MSTWSARIKAEIAAALDAAGELPTSARRDMLLHALHRCADVLERPLPEPALVAAAIRGAMQPVAVLATEDPSALAIVAPLGAAFDATLAMLRPARLEAVVPSRLADELTAVSRDVPRAASITRDLFVLPTVESAISGETALDRGDHGDLEPNAAEADGPDGPEGVGGDALAPARERREDWRAAEGVAPEPPPVWLLEPRKTVTVADFHAAVVEQCLDAIGSLARDRSHDPFALRPIAERRILAATDAILATGGACVATVLGSWARAIESPQPWCSWAAPFVLACVEGADALLAVRHGLEQLAPNAATHAALAAEALATSRHPDRAELAIDLAGSPHPVARAVGVDLLARGGHLTVEQLREHVFDANIPVVIAALRAIGRLSAADGAPLAPLLQRWIHFPDPEVAWLAAIALLRWGNPAPHEDLRNGGKLAAILGGRAVEIFVLAGSKSDLEPLQAIVARAARTPALLAAFGRFGHPGVWAFLVHYLADEDLADAASAALVTLFGSCVEPDSLLHATAWRSAITKIRPDPGLRYHRGEPWRIRGIAAECASGELARVAMEPLIDEITARARLDVRVDLGLWTAEARPMLAALTADAVACDDRWTDSSWA